MDKYLALIGAACADMVPGGVNSMEVTWHSGRETEIN